MAKNPTTMAVVAAAMSDRSGRWLLQKRPPGKRHAGLWEFPGGKVEPGESPRAALVRELNEELTITVAPGDLRRVARASAAAGEGERAIVITLYSVAAWQGALDPEPGCEIRWFAPAELSEIPLAPLDVKLARLLLAG